MIQRQVQSSHLSVNGSGQAEPIRYPCNSMTVLWSNVGPGQAVGTYVHGPDTVFTDVSGLPKDTEVMWLGATGQTQINSGRLLFKVSGAAKVRSSCTEPAGMGDTIIIAAPHVYEKMATKPAERKMRASRSHASKGNVPPITVASEVLPWETTDIAMLDAEAENVTWSAEIEKLKSAVPGTMAHLQLLDAQDEFYTRHQLGTALSWTYRGGSVTTALNQ